MQNIRVERLSSVTETLVSDLTNLLSELSETALDLEADVIKGIINSELVQIFVAYDDAIPAPAGMLTLVCVTLLSGKKCIIEDVIVGTRFRRRGIASELLHSAIVYSRTYGARYIDLTSRSERVAANELYKKTGFIKRQTNVYRRMLLEKLDL
ncbi:GCN5-related N-acetyltransferase [Dickeya parazeae Ech586]|uniref:GCN5-related N-acetyltransferase n=1 Tax=Dickeya zeae (strain Ech586) TaxID=590409 RepID=D2BXW2_DICZ5|nr:GNAT family N-acetyltransferase [Dickeya parazeae]ACZ76566.1 GCN5-related N-acetyltransferase [Dickeya parazeae Ech586]